MNPSAHPPDRAPEDEPLGEPQRSDARRSWRRLVVAGRPRATRANLLAAALALALGFAIVVQLRATSIEGLEGLREDDLVRILATVNQDNSRLAEELTTLQGSRDQLIRDNGGAGAVQAAQDRLDSLGILAGTVGAQGQGIVMMIEVPSGDYTAAMLLDAVQELRDAGAEAIQIDDVRVVASTYFSDVGNDIAVDGHPIVAPFRVLAIGDSKTLSSAMAIPGGVVDNVTRVGGRATVEQVSTVRITALHVVSPPRYARPVVEASPAK